MDWHRAGLRDNKKIVGLEYSLDFICRDRILRTSGSVNNQVVVVQNVGGVDLFFADSYSTTFDRLLIVLSGLGNEFGFTHIYESSTNPAALGICSKLVVIWFHPPEAVFDTPNDRGQIIRPGRISGPSGGSMPFSGFH